MQISELLKKCRLSDVEAVDENGDSLLHLVMKNKKFSSEQVVEVVQILLNEGVDPNIKNKKNQTVLHLAITKRAKDVIDCLLTYKVKLDHSIAHHLIEEENRKFDVLTKNPLEVSDYEMQKMEYESASFVEWIVSKGLDIDDVHGSNCDGPCALMLAIEMDLQHIISTLTKYTKDINFIKEGEYSIDDSDYILDEDLKGTVLHLFLDKIGDNRKYHWNRPEETWYTSYTNRYAASIVKMMLDKGVSTAVENEFGNTALHEAVLHKENRNIIDMLIEHTTNLNHKNNEGETPFYIVIYEWLESERKDFEYYLKISRDLVAKGANVNEPSNYGSSPLGNAVDRKNIEVIEFLRENGADFSLIPENGASLMHLLIKIGYNKMTNEKVLLILFRYLIANGCPVNAKEKKISANTPLHVAAKDGSLVFVRKLIECGADVNCKNGKGNTALHYVCKYNKNIDIAEILIMFGANASAMNSEGDTPLHLVAGSVRGEQTIDMLHFLLGYGADMNEGLSVIHRAVWKDYNRDSWGENVTKLHNIPDLIDCIEDYASDEVELLLEHWIKLDAAKFKYRVRGYIDEDLKNLVKLQKYKQIYQEYLDRVEVLKSNFIVSGISFYKYLHMDPTSRGNYSIDQELKYLVDPSEIPKQLPEYAVLVFAAYHETVTRKPLLEPAKVAWIEITKIYLPDICIERILSFLANADLFRIIDFFQ